MAVQQIPTYYNTALDQTSTNPINIGTLQEQVIITGKTFTSFDEQNDIVPNVKQIVTEALWSNNEGTLTTFATQSTQPAQEYYLNVYNDDPSLDTSQVQFSLAYGNINGKGASVVNIDGNDTSLTPSKAIYSQYRNILLDSSLDKFVINNETQDDILVINLQRARLKESLDPANWELTLSSSLGSFTYIDDSNVNSPVYSDGNISYNVCSGSIVSGLYTSGSSYVNVGKVYPTYGIIVFSGERLRTLTSMSILQNTNTDDNNHFTFYESIVGGASFKARNKQEIKSTYYFVRVKNAEYNYSNNPSFTTGSLGDLRNYDMYEESNTYITTIGLYNNSNELLAVAKISQPLLKNFQREALIKVKIDW